MLQRVQERAKQRNQSSPTPITILSVRPTPNQGNLRALVDIQVFGFTIRDCRIIQQPGQAPWVSMPVLQSADGFKTLVTLPDKLKAQVDEAVLAAWKKVEAEVGNEYRAS
jgi:DNA-binding cell septation regulator SpoVG